MTDIVPHVFPTPSGPPRIHVEWPATASFAIITVTVPPASPCPLCGPLPYTTNVELHPPSASPKVETLPVGQHEAQFTASVPGTYKLANVYGTDRVGSSIPLADITFDVVQLAGSLPPVPAPVAATLVPTGITVTWTDPAQVAAPNQITKFEVIATGAGAPVTVWSGALIPGVRTVTATNLPAATEHSIIVRYTNGYGHTDSAAVTCWTPRPTGTMVEVAPTARDTWTTAKGWRNQSDEGWTGWYSTVWGEQRLACFYATTIRDACRGQIPASVDVWMERSTTGGMSGARVQVAPLSFGAKPAGEPSPSAAAAGSHLAGGGGTKGWWVNIPITPAEFASGNMRGLLFNGLTATQANYATWSGSTGRVRLVF